MSEPLRAFFQSEELAEARPFYLIITILLLVVTALTLLQAPSAIPAGQLALFLALLALHVALHWLSAYAVAHAPWRLLYLPLQGGLALALVLLAQRPELTLALFGTLVAETLGLYGLTPLAAVAVVGYLLLTAVAFLAVGGWPLLAAWAEPIISTMALLILFMVLYRRQAEARQRTELLLSELETAHDQLAHYAAQVEALTLTAERQRMARELHDTLSQGVAGIILQLEAVKAHLEQDRVERAGAIITLCLKRARGTLAESRAAIDDLRLEDRSLSEAIERQVARFTRATGIPCHLDLALPVGTPIPTSIAEHAERIVGESLNNITRHAQASHVWLSVQQAERSLALDIRDDGVGFDAEKATRSGHYGLLGMRERARLVGGTFSVHSEPGEGSRLSITLPLEAA